MAQRDLLCECDEEDGEGEEDRGAGEAIGGERVQEVAEGERVDGILPRDTRERGDEGDEVRSRRDGGGGGGEEGR